jgi:hypothetical protein
MSDDGWKKVGPAILQEVMKVSDQVAHLTDLLKGNISLARAERAALVVFMEDDVEGTLVQLRELARNQVRATNELGTAVRLQLSTGTTEDQAEAQILAHIREDDVEATLAGLRELAHKQVRARLQLRVVPIEEPGQARAEERAEG